MTFLGKVKPKRWSRLLKLVDDLILFVVSRAIGEEVFYYRATWRTNISIIDSFIGVLVRAKIECEDIVKLC